METNLLNEVLACLDDGRRLIHYYKDKYAFFLLDAALSEKHQLNLSSIKKSHLTKLLQKPLVKQLTSRCGNGVITKQHLDEFYVNDYESYVITLSEWGCKKDYSWAQTSRPGKNLVVQLNFTGQHDQFMNDLNVDGELFKYGCHPVHNTKSSLAWARIDLDFETGEVLIEEIQNDWLREVLYQLKISKRSIGKGKRHYRYCGQKYNAEQMLEYASNTLQRYSKVWSEAMLFATIDFIKQDLGMNKIFYHTVETAKVLKNLDYSFPPVSLYTDLPKKFCFRKVTEAPVFLSKEKKIKRRLKIINKAKWFYLEL